MGRKPHPNKEIEEALRYAEQHGWKVDVGGIMHGERSIVLITMYCAGAGNFASRAYGLRRVMRSSMLVRFGELSITAQCARILSVKETS
jgi:hypothetical protein